ncbi:glycoside hydrolase family 32 protein [Youngiibacter fragilis]|uniref:Sucrose-6-phosphate hydrolase n=1 Tax=Youngiibacter fragilis 232.1 TaxID=994573 RepID=V7IAU5_9CLOT|nr:sucrose-6-phosphate hydrolase [Youngiibacter fragilis]ETA81977.1 sucrose-6-phosphate hydrolase [Youngiibacter fragilis 232.1]
MGLEANKSMEYHVLPPKGLLNDPNGLICYKGIYHVFFQWNPHGTDHGFKYWGHATSRDLVNYEYHDAALEPVDWFDKNGCYSGSSIEHDGKLYLFYTGNVKSDEGIRTNYQCAAVSEDGMSFRKIGPVTRHPEGYTQHMRDPKVMKGEDGSFYMVLGAQRDDLTGDTVAYRSADLITWEFLGSIMSVREKLGYMWECPDLLRLEGKDVFVFSPQGLEPEGDRFNNIFQTGYYTGCFQGGRFHWDGQPFEEMDKGFEFYAPQTFVDGRGRTILFGWMGTMPSEMEAAMPTVREGWIHHLTLPRVISFEGGKLIQTPVEELVGLRCEKEEKHGRSMDLDIPDRAYELNIKIKGPLDTFGLVYRNEVRLSFESTERRFTVERTNWATSLREVRGVKLDGALESITIYTEETSMEIFINGGEEVFSLRYFAKDEDRNISMEIEGAEAGIEAVSYRLESGRE